MSRRTTVPGLWGKGRGRVRAMRRVVAVVAVFGLTPGVATAATVDFTDWTSVSANVASGTLQGKSVSLSGSHVWDPPVSELGGVSNFFDDAALFTPPLAHTDHIQVSGFESYSYTLSFGAPVTDPVLHIASLGSTLQFPAGTQITRVSGAPNFTVSGNVVSGGAPDVAGGTIRLVGSIGSTSFTATTLYSPPVEDGVVLQVGAAPPTPPDTAPPTPPDTIITAGPAEGAVVDTPPAFQFRSTKPGSRFECNATWQSPLQMTGFRACSSPHTVPPIWPWGAQLRFEVRAIDAAGTVDPTPAQRTIAYRPPRLDLNLAGIEITQGVQERDCASSDGCRYGIMTPDYIARAFGRNPPSRYQGVVLSAARRTIVRVYVYAGGDSKYSRGAVVRLLGFDSDGRPLQPGFLLPQEAQAVIPPACCHSLSFTDRSDPRGAYTFTLPPGWSQHRTLRLRATVSPPAGRNIIETRPLDNVLDVVGIPFKVPTTIRLRPLRMDVRGIQPESPSTAFVDAQLTYPTRFEIPPFQGVVDATDAAQEPDWETKSAMASDLVDDWADDRDYGSGVYPFGLSPPGQGLDRGSTRSGWSFLFLSGRYQLYGDRVVSWSQSHGRGLTSVAHEMGHGLALPHAGFKCGSTGDGQRGSAWPPDDEGRSNGFGLDTRGFAPYRILGDVASANYDGPWTSGDVKAYWDLMSYCPTGGGANESAHWLSPRNWTHLLNYYAPASMLPARATARAATAVDARQDGVATLGITAFLDDSGAVSIRGVRRVTAAPTASRAASPWHVVVRDAVGRALSDTGAVVSTIESHAGDARVLRVKVPAAGAASVQITKEGKVVTERARSAHAPAVKIVSPRAGARLRSAKTVLRWRATDADRDPLTMSLDYSADAGGHWSTIFIGRNRGRVTLPTRLLTGSRNARLRVRANDGFNETAKTSSRFVSDGAPPEVSIITPSRGFKIRADATLIAEGNAYDDAGHRLSARSLSWRLGGRTLGHGRQLGAVDLPTGRRRLRLTGRDRHGRVGSASVTVRVLRVAPRFVELKAPRSISRTARRVRVRVVTNVSATLRIGHRRFHVTRRPRLVTVRVRPGRRTLRLRAVLTSSGQRSTAMLVIGRR